MNESRAFLDWGRFVAQCPEPGCMDARVVYHPQTGQRQTRDTCANGHPFRIVMPDPDDEARIMAAVAGRPEADQRWYPDGHEQAEAAGLPAGESVAQLRADTDLLVAQADADRERRDKLRNLLADNGFTVGPDGTFGGQL